MALSDGSIYSDVCGIFDSIQLKLLSMLLVSFSMSSNSDLIEITIQPPFWRSYQLQSDVQVIELSELLISGQIFITTPPVHYIYAFIILRRIPVCSWSGRMKNKNPSANKKYGYCSIRIFYGAHGRA